MKKLVCLVLLMLLLLTWAGCVSQPHPISASPKVLIVLRSHLSSDMPYMTDNELGVMIDMLDEAGFKHWVTSLTDDPYKSDTRTITPDSIVGAVAASDFDAVILPCLAAVKSPASKEIVELVTEFYRQEKIIAAQYGSSYTLYEGGIIADEQLASSEVLQKGRIITSGCCPYMARSSGCEDGTRELIEKLIATLNN